MNIIVQMPQEEYEQLKARAELNEETMRKEVSNAFDAIFYAIERGSDTMRGYALIEHLRLRREQYIKGVLKTLKLSP
jgi:hypothetical protein